MRLSEMVRLMEGSIPHLVCPTKKHERTAGLSVISGVASAMRAARALKPVPSLRGRIDALEAVSEVAGVYVDGEVTVSAASASGFARELAALRSDCVAVVNAARDVLPPASGDIYAVRLPLSVDLGTLSRIAKEFAELLDLLMAGRRLEGEARFAGTESGSAWLYVKLTGAVAAVFRLLVEAVYAASEKSLAIRKSQFLLRQLEVKTELVDDMGKVVRACLRKEMQRINETQAMDLDTEAIERYVLILSKITGELEHGTQIHTPIANTEERIERLEAAVEELKLLSAPPEGKDG